MAAKIWLLSLMLDWTPSSTIVPSHSDHCLHHTEQRELLLWLVTYGGELISRAQYYQKKREWGWEVKNDELYPRWTSKTFAPGKDEPCNLTLKSCQCGEKGSFQCNCNCSEIACLPFCKYRGDCRKDNPMDYEGELKMFLVVIVSVKIYASLEVITMTNPLFSTYITFKECLSGLKSNFAV